MELKNAVAVCLIAVVSATLVLLTARALDMQTAERLEPQLAQIVEELRAIRAAGGMTAGPSAAELKPLQNGLVVYYFHGTKRCPTCEAIESQAREVIQTDFAAELQGGEMTWKMLNYEQPAVAELTKRFEIMMPVIVLARMKDGGVGEWKRLDRVWALVGDKPAFAEYVRGEIRQMLGMMKTPADTPDRPPPPAATPSIPLPSGDADASPPLPLPEK